MRRKKKYKEPNASFYKNRGGHHWNYEALAPFRGTADSGGFNLSKQ